jgi:hypothetical protein
VGKAIKAFAVQSEILCQRYFKNIFLSHINKERHAQLL